MTQFNEDHPDFEQYVKGFTERKDADVVVDMIQLACPVQMLLFLLHNEIRGLRRQVAGTIANLMLILLWILAPLLDHWFGTGWDSGPVVVALGGVLGGAFVLQVLATLHRMARYRGFIRPAHATLHTILESRKEEE